MCNYASYFVKNKYGLSLVKFLKISICTAVK